MQPNSKENMTEAEQEETFLGVGPVKDDSIESISLQSFRRFDNKDKKKLRIFSRQSTTFVKAQEKAGQSNLSYIKSRKEREQESMIK